MRTTSQLPPSLLRAIQVLILSACIIGLASAQTQERKDKEVSLSGSYQSFTRDYLKAFFISTRLGYSIAPGLELEPETMFMFAPEAHPVYMLNGNASYSFSTNKIGNPFILVGYGLANTFPIINNGRAVGVLNIGVGVKIFLEQGPTFRIDYRFQKFTSPSSSNQARFHTVHLGVVVFS